MGLLQSHEFDREILDQWIFGTTRTRCKIIEYIEVTVSCMAVLTHALTAHARYRSLSRPYLPKMKARQVKNAITFFWIAAVNTILGVMLVLFSCDTDNVAKNSSGGST